MKRLVLLCAVIIAALQCNAQLYMQNNTTLPVRVAYILPVNTGNYHGLISHGWEVIKPRERKLLTNFTGGAKILYYYAESTDRSYGGTSNFVVDSASTFNITEPDIMFRQSAPTNYWRPFRKVAAPTASQGYTIILND